MNRPSSILCRKAATFVACLVAAAVVSGCASTKVSNRQTLVTEKLTRPGHILVYDFAATGSDVPPESALAGKHDEHPKPQTEEDIAAGRKLGAQIASELVEAIRGMGLPALVAAKGTTAQVNDLVIHGYLISIHEGSTAKRVAIGFGAGASELRTAVEGFQMTAQGLRKIGSGTVDSGGSKTPGAALGVAGLIASGNPAGLIVSSGVKIYGEASGRSKVEGRAKQTAKEIADVLQKRFQEEGWIQ